MSEKIATLKKEEDISILILDDGKANVFSAEMSKQVNECLDQVEIEKGCLSKEKLFTNSAIAIQCKEIENGAMFHFLCI